MYTSTCTLCTLSHQNSELRTPNSLSYTSTSTPKKPIHVHMHACALFALFRIRTQNSENTQLRTRYHCGIRTCSCHLPVPLHQNSCTYFMHYFNSFGSEIRNQKSELITGTA